MNIREIVTLRKILLAFLVSTLAACGGSDDDGGGGASSNNVPVLDESIIINPVLSDNDTDTECKYLDSDLAGVRELRCDFTELTKFKVAGQDEVTPDGLTFKVSLLTGMVDKDNSDALSVKDVRFVYPGTSCLGLNPITVERDFPECGTLETIRNILAESLSPDELLEYDLLGDDAALLLYQTRIALSRPRFTDDYGFELTRDSVLVTPTELIPVLNTNERAEVHLSYTVTDGKDEVTRRIRLVVSGESSAPLYGGRDLTKPKDRVVIVTGEEETLLNMDLLDQVTDLDIEQLRLIEEANGVNSEGLINGYTLQDVRFQFLTIKNFVPIAGTTGVKGAASGAGYRVGDLFINSATRRPVVQLFIDTEYFQSRLEDGEFVDLVFQYDIVDSSPSNANIEGQQFVERLTQTMAVRVQSPRLGVNFAEDNLIKNFGEADPATDTIGMGAAVRFSLLEGASVVNGGVIQVQDLVSDDEDTFGVIIDRADNTVTVDSTAFLNVKPGVVRTLVFSYVLTDTVTSIPYSRKLTVNVTGQDLNVLKDIDFGFESNMIAKQGDEPEEGGWSTIALSSTLGSLAAAPAPGDTPFEAGGFVAKTGVGFAALALPTASFPQKVIGSNARISVNFWAKQQELDSNLVFGFTADDDTNRLIQRTELPKAQTTDWEEYTVYLRASINDFNGQSDIGFYIEKGLSGEVLLDNVRILPWRDVSFFDYQEDGTFDSGVLGDFVTNAPGNVVANQEAKFTGDNGLEVDTIGQTEPTTVSLPSSAFVQGISNGSRYRFNADLRFPEHTAGNDLIVNVSLVDEATPTRKLTKTLIVDQEFWLDRSVTFDIDSLNSDNANWSEIDVRLELEFPDEGKVSYLDNIRFYQVP